MLASQKLVKELAKVVVQPGLDGLKATIPLDARADVTAESRGNITRWFWKGLLYTDDRLSVRVSLGCLGDAVVRAKVRAYYDKPFASVVRKPPKERNRQEIYTGKTRKFRVDTNSESAFNTWLNNELRSCTAALQRST
jgi:hypothetical protein